MVIPQYWWRGTGNRPPMNLHLSLNQTLTELWWSSHTSNTSQNPSDASSRRWVSAPIFKPHNTLKQALVNLKDRVPVQQKAGMIYRIPCKDCPKGNFGPPAEGAQRALTSSNVAQSVVVEHGTADTWYWLVRCHRDGCRAAVPPEVYTESWHIRSEKSSMNRDEGNLPPIHLVISDSIIGPSVSAAMCSFRSQRWNIVYNMTVLISALYLCNRCWWLDHGSL